MNKDYLEVGQKLYYGVLTFDKIDVEDEKIDDIRED